MILNVGGMALGTAAILGNVQWKDVNPTACTFDFTNTSYNAAQLRTNSFYYVRDVDNALNQRNYTYFFNVCGNLPMDPTIFSQWPTCNTTYAGYNNHVNVGDVMQGKTMAVQFSNVRTNPWDMCHRLGGPATKENIQMTLIDPQNPSFGFIMQYLNGDKCYGDDGVLKQRRSLRLWLICDNDSDNVPDDEPVLESMESCTYDIYIKTIAGCPSECPTPFVSVTGGSQQMLCGGHGVCGFDAKAGNSRCFCNDGFAGADCTGSPEQPPTGLSTLGGVLIGIGILLALLIAGLAYLWLRIRALRLDPTAYSSLRGGPEEGAAGDIGSDASKGVQ